MLQKYLAKYMRANNEKDAPLGDVFLIWLNIFIEPLRQKEGLNNMKKFRLLLREFVATHQTSSRVHRLRGRSGWR